MQKYENLVDLENPEIFNPSVPKDEVVMLVVDLPQRVSKSFLIAFFAKFKLFDMMRYTIVR